MLCAHNARDALRSLFFPFFSLFFFCIRHLRGVAAAATIELYGTTRKITDNNDDDGDGDNDTRGEGRVRICAGRAYAQSREPRSIARERDGARAPRTNADVDMYLSVNWPADRANKPRCNLIENAPAENTCASDEFRSSFLSLSLLCLFLSPAFSPLSLVAKRPLTAKFQPEATRNPPRPAVFVVRTFLSTLLMLMRKTKKKRKKRSAGARQRFELQESPIFAGVYLVLPSTMSLFSHASMLLLYPSYINFV